jgi:exopolysaccharide biosynthesis polyprenyl glycosylphosphotransferase
MTNAKKIIILLGDILILYGALMLTLIVRYGPNYFESSLKAHLKPFSIIFLVWLLIFYLADLYKGKHLRVGLETIQTFVIVIVSSAAASVILFYLFPSFFKLTPKTNLAIFSLSFGILSLGWRLVLGKIYISSGWRDRLLIIGDSPIINQAIDYSKHNLQIGYDVVSQIKEISGVKVAQDINKSVTANHINAIVIQSHFKKDLEITKVIYQLLSSKIAVMDFVAFYEMIFQKVPLEELEESWFIEKITTRRHLYDAIKRLIDIGLSLSLLIILLPLILIIAILTKLSSRQEPVIYKQERVGANNKLFTLYKFGTMRVDQGPLWTLENDKRLTLLGRFLRHTHLDEIPQLYNILKGDISFIGPRPERKELAELYQQLPYYEIRHLIKPGLTGWAQLNYKPSASVEEAKEKLEYDIYYIKNRSLVLDFLILLRTVKYLFISPR